MQHVRGSGFLLLNAELLLDLELIFCAWVAARTGRTTGTEKSASAIGSKMKPPRRCGGPLGRAMMTVVDDQAMAFLFSRRWDHESVFHMEQEG